jgi:uncharacterized protein
LRSDFVSGERARGIDIDSKVAFLARPESYPEGPTVVDVVQTHMSWVFLTDEFAYKLKKPLRLDFLDFSTLDKRQHNCLEELRLNRRLAPDVYLAVVPLTETTAGELALAGAGQPVDWLVKMRRLPRENMLDHVIGAEQIDESRLRQVVRVLAEFYRRAPPEPISTASYVRGFEQDIEANQRSLSQPHYRLPVHRIDAVSTALRAFLRHQRILFDERVAAQRVVEGHGDLRPEHVCLSDPPVIIDCLEFNRGFRILDPADELSFLAMECEHAGAPFVGPCIFEAYREYSGDDPLPRLRSFYMAFRAMMRAKLSIWHLDDDEVADPDKWQDKAEDYLRLAQRHADALDS